MASFGESLKRERELREISLREISDATKINIRYLEALEENRFDVLPGGLFNKGFIRAYARYIGVDGEAMVDRYLVEIAPGMRHAPEPGSGPPPIHRPVETVRRRADSQGTDSGRADHQEPATTGDTAGPSITFAETQPPARGEAHGQSPTRGETHGQPSARDDQHGQARREASTAAQARHEPAAAAHPRHEPAAPAHARHEPASSTQARHEASAHARHEAPSQGGARHDQPQRPMGRDHAAPVRLSVTPPQPVRTATAAALAAVLEAPRGGMYPAAVSAIESAPDDPGSRALTWILALVGGAAVLFLVLSLVMRRDAPQMAGNRQGHGAASATRQDQGAQPASASGGFGAGDTGARTDAGGADASSAGISSGTGSPAGGSVAGRSPDGTSSAGPIAPPAAGGRTREGAGSDEESRAAAAGAPAHKRSESGSERAARAPLSPPEDEPADAGSRSEAAQPAGGERAGRGPMDLQVETTDSTWVQVICDGSTAINRVMREGEAENLACLGSIRVSTINAGAVRLSVNGAPCLPLGERGKRVYGYTIRIDDFGRICPGSRRGGDGRN